VSDDLRSLLALLVAGHVSPGIAAAKIDDEWGDEGKPVAQFLREWEEHDRYSKVAATIVEKK
jgi:hypothetical protein